jgi:hypothetical protein
MKCLKSIKTNEIIRVSDEKAYNVSSEWKFIPKSEWKAQFKKATLQVEEVAVAEPTIAEKQLKKKKSK